MARNVEIKARSADLAGLEQRTAALANAGPTHLEQDDTFFRCAAGRLKLRAFDAQRGELIFYRRSDGLGPKESFYLRAATATPAALRDALGAAYGEAGRVRKRRTVYLIGRTRVHLDRVEGLGDFVELEVVLDDGESTQAGLDEARRLMPLLGIRHTDLLEGAYVDLDPAG